MDIKWGKCKQKSGVCLVINPLVNQKEFPLKTIICYGECSYLLVWIILVLCTRFFTNIKCAVGILDLTPLEAFFIIGNSTRVKISFTAAYVLKRRKIETFSVISLPLIVVCLCDFQNGHCDFTCYSVKMEYFFPWWHFFIINF